MMELILRHLEGLEGGQKVAAKFFRGQVAVNGSETAEFTQKWLIECAYNGNF